MSIRKQFNLHLMSSQDVIIYKVLLLIFYIILSGSVDISVFCFPKEFIFAGAYAIKLLVLVTVQRAKGGGAQSHFNVPPERVTVAPLILAATLLNSSRLWITTTLQRDTSKSGLTAQQGATLAHFKNPSIQEPSLEACYTLNVSGSKLSSDHTFPASM